MSRRGFGVYGFASISEFVDFLVFEVLHAFHLGIVGGEDVVNLLFLLLHVQRLLLLVVGSSTVSTLNFELHVIIIKFITFSRTSIIFFNWTENKILIVLHFTIIRKHRITKVTITFN